MFLYFFTLENEFCKNKNIKNQRDLSRLLFIKLWAIEVFDDEARERDRAR